MNHRDHQPSTATETRLVLLSAKHGRMIRDLEQLADRLGRVGITWAADAIKTILKEDRAL